MQSLAESTADGRSERRKAAAEDGGFPDFEGDSIWVIDENCPDILYHAYAIDVVVPCRNGTRTIQA